MAESKSLRTRPEQGSVSGSRPLPSTDIQYHTATATSPTSAKAPHDQWPSGSDQPRGSAPEVSPQRHQDRSGRPLRHPEREEPVERQPRVGQGIHDRLGLQVTDG